MKSLIDIIESKYFIDRRLNMPLCKNLGDALQTIAKIELLNKYEAMIEEMKGEADSIRNSIKAEMEAREVEELIAGQYIIRWTSVLSNRFDSTSFKRVCPDLYKAYTKQVSSRRFTITA